MFDSLIRSLGFCLSSKSRFEGSSVQDKPNSESGNAFTVVMSGVAMLGILTMGTVAFMKGPLSSAVKITRHNTAETQINIASRLVVLDSNADDCDGDGFVEPAGMAEAGSGPGAGGLLPTNLGAPAQDPWGNRYGYCVWDLGGTTGVCAGDRLTGPSGAQSVDDQRTRPVVVIVSAGQNKTFESTCSNFNIAGEPDQILFNRPSGSDDLIFDYTYAAAQSASGGLWQVDAIDTKLAQIDQALIRFGNASSWGADETDLNNNLLCNLNNMNSLRFNPFDSALEVCEQVGPAVYEWKPLSGQEQICTEIGQEVGGGVCLETGINALIAAPEDEGGGSVHYWGTYVFTTGSTSATDGLANTLDVYNHVIAGDGSHNPNDGSTPNAFVACHNKTTGGYDDWYLPAKDELNLLWTNRASIDLASIGIDTGGTYYWSSSEANTNNAWLQRFYDGYQTNRYKNYGRLVRCVRRAGSQYLRSDQDDIMNGSLFFNGAIFDGYDGDVPETGSADGVGLWLENAGGDVYRDTGNVGIGTNNPTSKLHIETSATGINTHLFIKVNQSTGEAKLSLSDATNGMGLFYHGASDQMRIVPVKASDGSWDDSTSTVTVFERTGNVGIGTTTPSAKLEVVGNVIASTPTADNHLATKAYVDSNGGGGIQSALTTVGTQGAACTNIGELAVDGSNNLLVCKDSTNPIAGGDCSSVGEGTLSLDINGDLYACLN